VQDADLNQYYSIVEDITQCDVVIFPIDYGRFFTYKESFDMLLALARMHNKPIWLYTAGDFGFTVYLPNSYNFRLGGFHSKLDKNTYIMPSFINDPYDKISGDKFVTINKSSKPIIGFVGHADTGFYKFIKEYLNYIKLRFKRVVKNHYFDKQSFYPSSIKRAHYLNILRSNQKLETNFIFRKKYKGKDKLQSDKTKVTREFYNNMLDNLYTFCIRGVGNFSVRFYETLACGRIPILLNTDCRLPLSNHINLKEHCVIINETGISPNEIAAEILKFHNSRSDDELVKLQAKNRTLWKDFLKRKSYFIRVHDNFVNINE
jgi:hypothetical protein